MKTTNGLARRVLLVSALLLLAPASASAQKLASGWYDVKSDNLSVRDRPNRLVMGTLFGKRADKFYIVSMSPSNAVAWGFARGVGFEGCGWVLANFRNPRTKRREKALTRSAKQPAAPGQCNRADRDVPESNFATPFPGATGSTRYINLTPRGKKNDGHKSRIQLAAVNVYGNYRKVKGRYEPANELLNSAGKVKWLQTGDQVHWRYFTKDTKYVMVRYGGTDRPGSGLWGFVKCENIRPFPDRAKDHERFYKLCPAAKR